MLEIIASIIFFASLAGIFIIAGKKIPAVLELPVAAREPVRENNFGGFLSRLAGAAKKLPFFKNFSWQLWIEKTLFKARVVALKADNKISNYLSTKRTGLQDKNGGVNDDSQRYAEYWSDVKKFVKTKAGFRIKRVGVQQVNENIQTSVIEEGKKEIFVISAAENHDSAIEENAGVTAVLQKQKKKHSRKKSASW